MVRRGGGGASQSSAATVHPRCQKAPSRQKDTHTPPTLRPQHPQALDLQGLWMESHTGGLRAGGSLTLTAVLPGSEQGESMFLCRAPRTPHLVTPRSRGGPCLL